MAAMLYSVFLLFCLLKTVCSDVLCENGFCRKYRLETGCSSPAVHCAINNATHSGITLPSPTICNCCDYCLPFIVKNDYCSPGGTGMGTTIGRCGAGLTCVSKADGDPYCERMNTKCHTAQDQFDQRHAKGETGALEERPTCDEKGQYSAFACVPTQTCFCQSLEGERIFGEVLYTGQAVKQNMHCGCSRLHEKIKKNIEPGTPHPVAGPRCTADGNFHPIQCFGRICHCVNRITGVILEGNRRTVDLNENSLASLECYDPEEDLYPEQNQGSPPYNFTTPCYENQKLRMELLENSQEEGFNVDFASSVPRCLPDGTFARISTTRNRTKICVDERGRRIGDYEAFPDTKEFDEMNCKCAYTWYVMGRSPERPVCCSNGNYRSVQCRRGSCRCVDADGRQLAKENADPRFLHCFTPNWRTC